MKEMYERLLGILEDEVNKVVKDGEVTQTTLCNLDTLVDVIKDIHEISAMSESSEYSGSRRMGYNDDGYSGRMYYDSYERGNSNARNNMYGRNDDNRYYDDRRNNDRYVDYMGNMRYSGHDEKDKMISLMEEAMEHADSKEDKDAIMKMIQKMNK